MLLSYLAGAVSLLPSREPPWPLTIRTLARALPLALTLPTTQLGTETTAQNIEKMHFLLALPFHPGTVHCDKFPGCSHVLAPPTIQKELLWCSPYLPLPGVGP